MRLRYILKYLHHRRHYKNRMVFFENILALFKNENLYIMDSEYEQETKFGYEHEQRHIHTMQKDKSRILLAAYEGTFRVLNDSKTALWKN